MNASLPKRLKPRRNPVQERSQLTVDSIVDAAIQVFEAHGYAAGTTARIAERAGISIGSLYQYFPNKDAIVVAVARRHLSDGEALLHQLLREPADPRIPLATLLHGWVAAMLELHAKHPRLHRMLFEQVALPPVVWAAVAQLEQMAAAHLAERLATRQDLSVADPLLAASMIVELIESTTHRLVLHPPMHYTREQVANELVLMLVSYLQAQRADRQERLK